MKVGDLVKVTPRPFEGVVTYVTRSGNFYVKEEGKPNHIRAGDLKDADVEVIQEEFPVGTWVFSPHRKGVGYYLMENGKWVFTSGYVNTDGSLCTIPSNLDQVKAVVSNGWTVV